MNRNPLPKRLASLSLVCFCTWGISTSTAATPTVEATPSSEAPRYVLTDLGFNFFGAVNNRGVVAGTTQGGYRAILFSGDHFEILPALNGAPFNSASSINDSGQVVGVSSFPSEQRAFLYANGSIQDLGAPPGKNSAVAADINNQGQVVGYSSMSRYDTQSARAFLYSNGSMADLGTIPGGTYSFAEAINDVGQVVGWAGTPGGARAFLYSHGVMSELPMLPGAAFGRAADINNRGDVVGHNERPGQTDRAFLYSGGVLQDLSLLGMEFASAINERGEVVGSGGGRALLYSGGSMFDLNSLVVNGDGLVLNGTASINDVGQIVVSTSLPGNFNFHSFLASPIPAIPEPVTGHMLLVGLLVLGGVHLHRRPQR
jgi:probable HAF family extracellular repeat protein